MPYFNYAEPNAYFVTTCTAGRRCLFGTIVDSMIQLNEIGHIVEEEWFRTTEIRREIILDAFVIMPNHLHGIVTIASVSSSGGDRRSPLQESGPTPRSLSSFVGGFKAAVTKRINGPQKSPASIWQRNYYEHVIRNEKSLEAIRSYIMSNPANWAHDRNNPQFVGIAKQAEKWSV
jgi:putative transposase